MSGWTPGFHGRQCPRLSRCLIPWRPEPMIELMKWVVSFPEVSMHGKMYAAPSYSGKRSRPELMKIPSTAWGVPSAKTYHSLFNFFVNVLYEPRSLGLLLNQVWASRSNVDSSRPAKEASMHRLACRNESRSDLVRLKQDPGQFVFLFLLVLNWFCYITRRKRKLSKKPSFLHVVLIFPRPTFSRIPMLFPRQISSASTRRHVQGPI